METRVRELLDELEHLIPPDRAQVVLYDSGDNFGSFPLCATPEGFLLFGLAFMRGAYAPSAGKGLNGGEKVVIDLEPIYRSDSNIEFLCERVAHSLKRVTAAGHATSLVLSAGPFCSSCCGVCFWALARRTRS